MVNMLYKWQKNNVLIVLYVESEKNAKKMKKGVDKREMLWYNINVLR